MNKETQGTPGTGEGHLEGEGRSCLEGDVLWLRSLLLFLRAQRVISKRA